MTRAAVAFDRLVLFLVGAALVTLAVATVMWQRRELGGGRELRVIGLEYTATTWWPWASAVVGVLLVVVGARWLLSHRWPARAGDVALGRNASGLSADVSAAARAAADRLSEQPAVLKATGTAVVEPGLSELRAGNLGRGRAVVPPARPTVTLTVTVPARRGLALVTGEVDDIAGTLSAMLGDTVAVRSVVRVKGTGRPVVR